MVKSKRRGKQTKSLVKWKNNSRNQLTLDTETMKIKYRTRIRYPVTNNRKTKIPGHYEHLNLKPKELGGLSIQSGEPVL